MRAYSAVKWLDRNIQYYKAGRAYLNSKKCIEGEIATAREDQKLPLRTEVINFLLSRKEGATHYLEIGVRNPEHNFAHIVASKKYAVDPGLEYAPNPVDFRMTSDEFFLRVSEGSILSPNVRFDVVFIDGLHTAAQVDRDIGNSLNLLADDGFVVLHDCNPPTEWHAREDFRDHLTPAGHWWNGTTWKAFMKKRCDPSLFSCCIDSDWGIGVLSKVHRIGAALECVNEFYDFQVFAANRSKHLNLLQFDEFEAMFRNPLMSVR